jgi:hypothetical protein
VDAILSWRALLALLSLGAVFVARAQEAVTVLELRLGIDADSQPTDLWLQAIAPFNDDEVLSDIAGSTSSFIDSDSAWFALIRDRSGLWPSLIPELLIPFPDTAPPEPCDGLRHMLCKTVCLQAGHCQAIVAAIVAPQRAGHCILLKPGRLANKCL